MQVPQTFSKEERLCSHQIIQKLFSCGFSFFEYPFKAIFIDFSPKDRINEQYPVQCLFSVSKRHFKKSVHRNQLKRLIREAYRKNKNPLFENLLRNEQNIALALVYNAKVIPDYGWLEVKIISIIKRLIQELNSKRPIIK